MAMQQTWRWFGPNDPVTLQEVRQTGAVGIVTALHHIPVGETWPVDEIRARKHAIEAEGLTWSVVESLPVHECIKTRSGEVGRVLENFKATLRNLGACGIDTVCYNFMPVLDWSRTDLDAVFTDGSITTKFDAAVFAAFDLFVLRRKDAARGYAPEIVRAAESWCNAADEREKERLVRTVLLGLPGSGEALTLEKLRAALETYDAIDPAALRDNLHAFLREVVPVAEESGVLLAVHPDDPPWPLLGLPRVVSTGEDIAGLLRAVDSPSNGITLCTGSLGAGPRNDLVEIAERFASRINFVHLRNVHRDGSGGFVEDNHLEGDVDMFGVIRTILLEQERRTKAGRADRKMPMRPDHGHLLLPDEMLAEIRKTRPYPGYSLWGRMRGLAELRGMELGIRRSLGL